MNRLAAHHAVPQPDLTDIWRLAVWDAINEYVAACGGNTGPRTVSGRRSAAVACVERALSGLIAVTLVRVEPPLIGRPSFWVLVFVVCVSLAYLAAIN